MTRCTVGKCHWPPRGDLMPSEFILYALLDTSNLLIATRQVVALRLGVGLEQFPLSLLAFAIFSGLIALLSWPGRQESNLHHEVRSLGGYPLPHDRIASRAFDAERHSHHILSQNRSSSLPG
jgi:hypothetical protein